MRNKKIRYDESSIQVLEGLEAVRKRPGMYIGSTDTRGLHHLIWEIVDNSIDEAMAGYCQEIKVQLNSDNSVIVTDDGRGIPIGKHKSGKPTPEVIFSILHAGGKFEEGAYKTSGGLHGVGASVVNALSNLFEVTIYRDRKISFISFEKGGQVKNKLSTIGKTNRTGTQIHFHPDPLIFGDAKFSFDTICQRLHESAFLNNGLKITCHDQKTNKTVTYKYENGLTDFMNYLNTNKKHLTPVISLSGGDRGIDVAVTIQYVNDFTENIISFANNVKTVDGGTHVTGFRNGLTKAINDYSRKENILKDRDKNFESYDIKEGLNAIISVKIPESLIQYEGQTKAKLGTNEAKLITEQVVTRQMTFWLQENKQLSYQLIDKCNLARIARNEARKAREMARSTKKPDENMRELIGKLTPAQGRNKLNNELFLVEGDSAGGSAKSGRDRVFQAILPLRGKVINAEKSKASDLLKNEEIRTMITAIGGGYGSNFNLSDVNYGKIIIMTDADTDGAHIQTLLLTFFYRYMKPLIENERIYIALPPLFKINWLKQHTVQYVWDESKLQESIKNTNERYELQRYKGLGEMNAEQLWETTMNPQNRQLILVTLSNLQFAENQVVILMGDDAVKRKEWIDCNVKFSLEDEFINLTK